VDGDAECRGRVAHALATRRIECEGVSSGLEALERAVRKPPDLVLCDFFLPDVSGPGLCRLLREHPELRGIPVVMVSSYGSEIDRVLAFESGVDDFLPKPFYASELSARVAAVLRGFETREPGGRGGGALDAGITVDVQRGVAEVQGRRVDLSPTEFDLLSTLVVQSGRVMRRGELLERVWGPDAPHSERAVDVHIKSIRRKLGEARDCIETVRGVGYRFADRR